MRIGSTTGALICSALLAGPVAAQQHAHMAGADDGLGTVHFATSCQPAVAPQFDRAVALLHSFEFGAAIDGFNSVLAADSTCAMAYWGIALARWTNPMAPAKRPPALLAQGRQATDIGQRLAARATERERGYLAAVSKLFQDDDRLDQRSRVVAYERAMEQLHGRHPDDLEGTIFYALAILGNAPANDRTYARQKQAAALLNALQPGAKAFPRSAVEEIAEQVNGLLARLVLKVELGAQFDGAHQIQPGLAGKGRRLVVSCQRIVVTNCQRLEPQGDRLSDQLRRRIASVGCVAVCVEIDQ